jgi:hypothetical protein
MRKLNIKENVAKLALGITLLLILLPHVSYSTTLHTISIDGSNDFSADEAVTSSTIQNTWYFTWDTTSFYVGINSPDIVSGGSGNKFANLYTDVTPQPNPLAGPGLNYTDDGKANLPFNADYAIRYRIDGPSSQWCLSAGGSSWESTTGVITGSGYGFQFC